MIIGGVKLVFNNNIWLDENLCTTIMHCEIFEERLILVISILSCNWFSPCRQLGSLFVLVPSELSR